MWPCEGKQWHKPQVMAVTPLSQFCTRSGGNKLLVVRLVENLIRRSSSKVLEAHGGRGMEYGEQRTHRHIYTNN